MNSFNEDLSLGVRAQDFIKRELKEELGELISSQGCFEDYDLIADNGYTIEVKYDKLSKDTKSIGIEYEYKGKPSGIARTKAMEWAHIYHNNGVVYSRIKTRELKAYIKTNWKYLIKTTGGDNKDSRLVLINKEDFINRFGFIPTSPIKNL